MRTSNADTAGIERALGPRGTAIINSQNRSLAQAWCISRGLPSRAAKAATLASLAQAYNDITDSVLTAWIEQARNGQPVPFPAGVPAWRPEAPRPADDRADESEDDAANTVPNPFPEWDGTAEVERRRRARGEAPITGRDGSAAPANASAGTGASGDRPGKPQSPDEAARAAMEKLLRDMLERFGAGNENNTSPSDGDASQPSPTPAPKPGKPPRHKSYDEVRAWLAAGANVYLVGPAGCGKTTLAEQIAADMELPFFVVGPALTRYEYSGFMDANGNYVPTAVYKAFTQGGLLLLDEFDGSAPAATLFLNSALANGYCAFPAGMEKRHPDFRCIVAANTFGTGQDRQYVGRNQQDAAALDRFAFVEMDYDVRLERDLYVNDDLSRDWHAQVIATRKAVKDLKIRHVVSPRATAMGIAGLRQGLNRKAVEAAVLWKGLEAEQVSKIKAALPKPTPVEEAKP